MARRSARPPQYRIFDAWYRKLVHRIFDDELGAENYELVPTPISDQDQWHDFSSFILNLFNRRARSAYARDYCDDMGTDKRESCKQQAAAALRAALTDLKTEQGEDMTAWTFPAWMISFQELGLGSVDPIPWQNRGTHNHAIEILQKAP